MSGFTFPFVIGQAPGAGPGSGTVTSVSVTTSNGVSGTVATSTTTPAITISLGPSVQFGGTDIAAPVAQTIKFQDVVAGTANTAGVNATIQAPAGTGTGAGGSFIVQVAPAGGAGSAKNAWSAALTIDSTKLAAFSGAILGATSITATTSVSDALGNVRLIPQNSQSAAYTTVLSDAGKHILHPSGDANARTFTIDSNANVAYTVGTAITFVNQTSQVVSIAITSDTMTLANTTTTGTRSLAQNGVATAIKIASTSWIISGTGLT